MANNQFMTILVLLVVAAFAFGWVQLPQGGNNGGNLEDIYPSDLKTTITLNTGDELATSATQVTTDYYVFDSAGDYLKGGQTSSGTASFTVPTGGNYKLIAFLDSGTEYLPKEVSFSTDAGDPTKRAVQTVNIDLRKSSAATINKFRNPIDLDTNITCSASQACHYDIMISSTTANAAVGEPVILIDVNSTAFDDVTMSGLTEVTCPTRVTVGSGRAKYCFKYDKDIVSDDGIILFTGTLYASSTGPASASQINATVLDTAMYAEPDYKTQGYSAFKTGTENPIDNSDIGAADSSTSTLTVD